MQALARLVRSQGRALATWSTNWAPSPPQWAAGAALQRSCATASISGQQTGEPGDAAAGPEPKPALVEKFISPDLMSRGAKLRSGKLDIIQEFQRSPGDVGSSEVQVALLTHRIRAFAVHFKENRKDIHNRRVLMRLLNRRRKLLQYLRRTDFERYSFAVHKLGLKDIYGISPKYDKYRMGSTRDAPAIPLKKYGTR